MKSTGVAGSLVGNEEKVTSTVVVASEVSRVAGSGIEELKEAVMAGISMLTSRVEGCKNGQTKESPFGGGRY